MSELRPEEHRERPCFRERREQEEARLKLSPCTRGQRVTGRGTTEGRREPVDSLKQKSNKTGQEVEGCRPKRPMRLNGGPELRLHNGFHCAVRAHGGDKWPPLGSVEEVRPWDSLPGLRCRPGREENQSSLPSGFLGSAAGRVDRACRRGQRCLERRARRRREPRIRILRSPTQRREDAEQPSPWTRKAPRAEAALAVRQSRLRADTTNA